MIIIKKQNRKIPPKIRFASFGGVKNGKKEGTAHEGETL